MKKFISNEVRAIAICEISEEHCERMKGCRMAGRVCRRVAEAEGRERGRLRERVLPDEKGTTILSV